MIPRERMPAEFRRTFAEFGSAPYGSDRGHKLGVIVGPDEQARQVFNLRDLATRHEDKGLAWSVLKDSVEGAMQILKQEGAGA
jgi:histidyl-tRNA synthetase